MASNTNEDLIRSHVDTIILASLINEDKYGLEILNEIKEKSNGLYTLKQPTLYSILKRLEKVGYIKSYNGSTSNGAARVYYSLLDDGKKAVLADQYEWEYSRTIINNLLSDKPYDPNSEPPFDASALRPLTKRQPSLATPKSSTEEQKEIEKDLPKIQQSSSNFENEQIKYDFNDDDNEYTSGTTGSDRLYHNPVPQPDKPSFESIFNTTVADQQSTYNIPVNNCVNNDNQSNQTINYITSFENLYKNSSNSVSDPNLNTKDDDSYEFYTINELKSNFAREGYVLRPYIKKNTTEYYAGKYYKANKLFLFSALAFYIIMLIEIFAVHYGLHYNTPLSLGLSILAISIIPIYALIKWALDPNKRSLAKFNIKTSLINSLIIIINLIIVIVIIGYFAFKANFSDVNTMIKPIFAPLGMLLNIPLAIVIYDLMYKSKYFHIN